jgi:hypothetical protein
LEQTERERAAADAAAREARDAEEKEAQLRTLRTELAQSRRELSEWGGSSASPARTSATDRAFARALSPRGHAEVLDHVLADALGCALEARAAAAMASTGGDCAIGAMWRRMAAAEEALLSSTDAARAAFSSAHFEQDAEQVSFLLCTVTFYANLADSLTRSP